MDPVQLPSAMSGVTYRLALAIALTWLLSACSSDQSSRFGEDVLFHDEFISGQTGSWLLEGDELGRAAVLGEAMLLEINAPQSIQFVSLEEPTFGDFDVRVDVTYLAGDPESSAGILLRMQGPDQFYRFDITASGLYLAERRDSGGSWMRFREDWTESEAIKKGLNVTNQLRVVARRQDFTFYVNNVELLHASDASFSGGKIALDAGTFGRPGLQVSFDNVLVRRP